jgi:hypothetical protein
MAYIVNQKLPFPEGKKIQPFAFAKTNGAIPAEGSVFFLVSSQPGPNRWATVSVERHWTQGADLTILETDGIYGDETVYLNQNLADGLISGYSPLFGSMMIGGGFQAAAGALIIARQVCYDSPATHNPHGLSLVGNKDAPKKVNKVVSIRRLKNLETMSTILER